MYRQAIWDEPLLSELSRHGRVGHLVPVYTNIRSRQGDPLKLLPASIRRSHLSLPMLSEPQVVRHFTRLSQMNFGVDMGMYPLGSCSMKYNPKVNERIARSSLLTTLHPYSPDESIQGIIELLYNLSSMLCEITGMARFSLAPAAGAHGELAGALIIRAWVREQGTNKDEMLIPDSAHGTNPATASLAGFRVVKVPSGRDGLVDVEALKTLVSRRTAGMMLTVPNTLGLFESRIEEIASIVHAAGGLMYYDGANMNALLGQACPSDMGFDIVHLNLHKTFSTPHGGGGPGAGPLGVSAILVDYLPIPIIAKENGRYKLSYDVPKTIGRIGSFLGNVGVLVRAYAYILMMGRDGLKRVSEQSVLAANYLRSRLRSSVYGEPPEWAKLKKHEFVVSVNALKAAVGVSAMDVAKSLLERGIHAPTIYFPLTVEEALMIEPTETEPLEALDDYARALLDIADKATKDPDSVKLSPMATSIGRLDEARASRPSTMKLNWRGI